MQNGYTHVNGLRMYYEIHGSGEPLLVLHGHFTTIAMFSKILPELAKTRRVIAVEQQGHGRTADIDRPLSFEQMADDTAATLRSIGITETDVFGYSSGGSVALHLAIRHPQLVRKLALGSPVYHIDGYLPQIKAAIRNPSPDFLPPALRQAYEQVAPNPKGWADLVRKSGEHARAGGGLTAKDVASIRSASLVLTSDHDVMRPEHAQELAQLLRADLVTLPDSNHSSYISEHPDALLSHLRKFLQ